MKHDSSLQIVSESTMCLLKAPVTIYREDFCILLSVRGSLSIRSGETEAHLSHGDLLLLFSPGEFFAESSDQAVLQILSVNPLMLMDALGTDFYSLPKLRELPGKEHPALRSAIVQLSLTHTFSLKENALLIRSRIYDLFHALKSEGILSGERSVYPDLTEKQARNAELLLSYLEQSYMENPTLSDAAGALSLTPQYLSNFIQKHMHSTFLKLLNQTRLRSALLYVLHTDFSVRRIAMLSGFSDPSSMEKLFREQYGRGPEALRNEFLSRRYAHDQRLHQITQPSAIRDHLFHDLPGDSFQFLRPIEKEKSIHEVLDVSKTEPLFFTWDQFINLGSAINLEDPTFRYHLRDLIDGMRFRHARISGILHLVLVYSEDEEHYSFDFSRIFLLIDYLLTLSLRPYLDFDNKTPDIYQNTGLATASGSIGFDRIGELLIPQLLRECINRYGFEEVSLWRFELWQRYYDPYMQRLEKADRYVDRFLFLQKILKTLLPKASLGGPGFNTFLPSDILKETLLAMKQKEARPDFITVYLYPYQRAENWQEETEHHFRLSSDPEEFRERLQEIRRVLADCGMEGIPLIVAEFSTNIVYRNHINDSMYLSVFLIKNFLSCRKLCGGMGYWLASDAALEYGDNEAFLFGGNGLLSRHGLRKPGFFAYAWLCHLHHRLVGEGEHFILTAGDREYALLLFHYAHFTDEYCEHSDEFDQVRYPDGAFLDTEPINLTLTLTSLPPGRYRITRMILSANQGSLFHEWGRLHYVNELSQYERDSLYTACTPHMSIETTESRGEYTVEEIIPRHTVLFYLIRREL